MVTTTNNTELEQLLHRSLFVKPAIKTKILAASPAKQAEVLPLIVQIDAKQTSLFKKALAKNPHFFADLETQAIHQVLTHLVEKEEAVRLDEINQAEQELNSTLNQF